MEHGCRRGLCLVYAIVSFLFASSVTIAVMVLPAVKPLGSAKSCSAGQKNDGWTVIDAGTVIFVVL